MLPPGRRCWQLIQSYLAWIPYLRVSKLSTLDILIKKACFVRKEKKSVLKAADLHRLVQGGQLCSDFPFGKGSLLRVKEGLQGIKFKKL